MSAERFMGVVTTQQHDHSSAARLIFSKCPPGSQNGGVLRSLMHDRYVLVPSEICANANPFGMWMVVQASPLAFTFELVFCSSINVRTHVTPLVFWVRSACTLYKQNLGQFHQTSTGETKLYDCDRMIDSGSKP
jgi:hypothetical protein